jgi:hypothetical protein
MPAVKPEKAIVYFLKFCFMLKLKSSICDLNNQKNLVKVTSLNEEEKQKEVLV